MTEYYADKLIEMITLQNIKENELSYIDENTMKLKLSDLDYKEITNVDLFELRKRLNRLSIKGELLLHRKENLFQYSWNTSDNGINLFASCGNRALSENSAFILNSVIPKKNKIKLLPNNKEFIELLYKDCTSIDNGFYLIKDKNNIYTAIKNNNGNYYIEDFDSISKALIFINYNIDKNNIQLLSETEIQNKNKFYTKEEINNIDFELTKLNIQNKSIVLDSNSELSSKLDLINWLNLNKPEHVKDFALVDIDDIQKQLDNWTLKVIDKNKILLCDSNDKEKCSGLYNVCNWVFNVIKEQRLFCENNKKHEKSLYTDLLVSEIHWKQKLYEFENISYLNNQLSLYPENVAPTWLPKHNAKLIKKAINENIAPFIPDDYGRLNCYPIYNYKNGNCLSADILIPAQIQKIARNSKSNYVISYSYILNNRIDLLPGTEDIFFNYKSADEKIKTSMFIFPESIRKKRIEKKLSKNAHFSNSTDLSQLTQEIIMSEPEDYLTAYIIGCKTGLQVKASKEIANDFIHKLNSIIENELLPDFKKDKNTISITTLFDNVEKKSNSLIQSISGINELNNKYENKKVRGYQRAREEITR